MSSTFNLQLQDLVIVVRDAKPEHEEEIRKIIKTGEGWNKEQKVACDKMAKTFDNVQTYILPRPGIKVTKGEYTDSIAKEGRIKDSCYRSL